LSSKHKSTFFFGEILIRNWFLGREYSLGLKQQ